MRPIRKIGKVIGIMVVVALAAMLFGYFVMHLWNWLIPGIFHGAGFITFWQAVGLLVLARILFGFGGGHGHHRGWHNRMGHQGFAPWNHGGPWGDWREKWQNMTPEEREKMKGEWKNRAHSWKQKWHDMSPEEKMTMKMRLRNRCGDWGDPSDFMAKKGEGGTSNPSNPETPNS